VQALSNLKRSYYWSRQEIQGRLRHTLEVRWWVC